MKVGIIGTGFGRYAMAPAFKEVGFEVTEVVSPRDAEGVARVAASDVDLVSIHSPPFMHKDHVMAVLKAGRHVLCDKPFGRDAAEARAMLEAARAAGVLHFLNFELREKPFRLKLVELLRAGAIGKVRHVSWTSFSGVLSGLPHGWLQEREPGGGWLGAYGSHCIDFIRLIFGCEAVRAGGVTRVEKSVRADKAGVMHKATADDAFSLWMAMEGGGTAVLDTAACASGATATRITVLGDAGVADIVDETHLTLRRASGPEEQYEFGPLPAGPPLSDMLRAHLAHVRDAIAQGQQIAPSFEDGLRVAEVMDQVRVDPPVVAA